MRCRTWSTRLRWSNRWKRARTTLRPRVPVFAWDPATGVTGGVEHCRDGDSAARIGRAMKRLRAGGCTRPLCMPPPAWPQLIEELEARQTFVDRRTRVRVRARIDPTRAKDSRQCAATATRAQSLARPATRQLQKLSTTASRPPATRARLRNAEDRRAAPRSLRHGRTKQRQAGAPPRPQRSRRIPDSTGQPACAACRGKPRLWGPAPGR